MRNNNSNNYCHGHYSHDNDNQFGNDSWDYYKNRTSYSSCPARPDRPYSPYRSNFPTRSVRPVRPIRTEFRTEFSEKEKAEILSRVIFVGIERAAMEARTSKEIVMRWLQLIDESISEINSEWDKIEAAGGIAGYEIDYERVIERRNHYKKPLEQIIAILTRAEEVGTRQAARELRSIRNEIIRWQRLFPKQIWEQIRQWARDNRDNNKNSDSNSSGYENSNILDVLGITPANLVPTTLTAPTTPTAPMRTWHSSEELIMPTPVQYSPVLTKSGRSRPLLNLKLMSAL